MALYTVHNLTGRVVVPPAPFGQKFQPHETKTIPASISDAENDAVRNAIARGLISVSSANDPSFPDAIEVGALNATINPGAITATELAANAVTTAKIAAAAVTAAKAAVFTSAEQTGTGAPQNVAHGLGAVPAMVLPVPTAGHDGLGAAGDLMPTLVEGAHDATNVVVTAPAGSKFKVLAWA